VTIHKQRKRERGSGGERERGRETNGQVEKLNREPTDRSIIQNVAGLLPLPLHCNTHHTRAHERVRTHAHAHG
jgi:hypothetical protein